MMADTARAKADRELQRMERHLADIYSRCGKELEKKAADFLADFTRLDEQHKKDVDSGTWTQEEYDEWRKNKLLYGQKWDRLIDYAKKELANANKTAIDYINGKTTQVYADSYNHLQEVIDNSNVKGYNFELVDAETVRNLYDNDELMLPHKDLDKEKDQAWNAKAINAEILQGILQGDSIPKIAQRMNNVATKNDVAAVRTARTMITAAENSGRQAGMNKAEEDGIEFWKMWIATSDERTRESHNVLNGQCIPNGEMFVTIDGEELEFPGDWRADGSEVYNCRCTLGTIIKGFNKKKLDEAIEEQQEQQLEIEQQTEVEEPEASRDYIESLSDEIRESAKSWEGVSDSEVDVIVNSLSNCPEHMSSVIRQTLSNATLIVADENRFGCTCYDPTGNTIYILREDVNSPDFAEAFWHEYMHYVDTPKNSGSSYSQVNVFEKRVWLRDENGEVVYIDNKPQKTIEREEYVVEGITAKLSRGGDYNERYQNAVVNDMNNLLERIGISEYYEMRKGVDEYSDQQLWNRQTNEIIDTTCMNPDDLNRIYGSMRQFMYEVTGINEARNYIYDLGYPRTPKKSDYIESYYTPKRHQYKEKEKYSGAEEEYKTAYREAVKKQDEWEKSHDMEAIEKEIKRLESEAEAKSKLYGFATDSLDGAVNGALVSENLPGGGHSADYYMFNNNAIREEIANVGSAVITQNQDVIDAMETVMPELYKLIKEVLEDA